MAALRCPSCQRGIGGRTTEGDGWRVRLSITLIGDNGDLHGPCPHCKSDVIVAKSSGLSKALAEPADVPVLVLRVARRT